MKKRAILFIVIASILWGTSGIFVHYLAPYGFSSLELTFARHSVAAVLMAFFLFFYNKKLFRAPLKGILILVACGLGLVGTGSFYYASMQAASISTAVVLMYTAPVIVMAVSVAFLGEKLTKSKFVSVILMVAGCALVSGVIGGLSFQFWGILFGLCSGLSYSAYNIVTKMAMEKGYHPYTATFYTFLVAGFVAFCLSDPGNILACTLKEPAVTLPLLFFLGVFTSILPYFLYTLALKDIPAGTATSLSVVEPMSATLFSVALFGEKLSVFSLTGIIFILLALLLLSKSES
ncbi:MAG: EamA family transporter [Clostridia bacterium]|nr:EamA family transporter [Clostridia bacterium]